MSSEVESISWVPVTRCLPDDDISVLVYAPVGADWDGELVWIGHHDGDVWIDTEGFDWPEKVVTHWAAMPNGPSQCAKESQP